MEISREEHYSRYHFYGRLVYCVFVILTFIALITNIIYFRNSTYLIEDSIDYSDMWSYDTGSLVDFNELKTDDHISMHKRTNGEITNNKDLCFYTKNIYFTVYLNDTVIYDFHPNPPKLFGKAYGIYPHSVTIPVYKSDGNLYIEIDRIYPENSGFIHGIHLDNSNRFIITELQKSSGDFILCLIGMITGLVLITIGIIGRHFGEKRFEIISNGTFALLASLWMATDTMMLPLLTGAPIAVHFTLYISLTLLPLPAILFISSATGNSSSKFTPLVFLTTFTILIYTTISTVSGGKDYHQLLRLIHVNIAFTSIIIMYFIISSIIKNKTNKRTAILLILAFLIATALGITDISTYLLDPTAYVKAFYSKYSFFVFIILSGIYEFLIISEMSRRGQYAEIMEELAFQDGLTDLLNRKAFNKAIEEASKSPEAHTLIMLDMNYLKKANDELGHSTGDLYIKTTAKVIAESFVNGEQCFRIGGDEFFVMANYPKSDSLLTQSLDTLHQKIACFNKEHKSKIPLSIAYGITEYNPERDNIEECVRISDEKMYAMKTEMKAVRTD